MRTIPVKITLAIKRESEITPIGAFKTMLHIALFLILTVRILSLEEGAGDVVTFIFYILMIVTAAFFMVRSILKNICLEDKLVKEYRNSIESKDKTKYSTTWDIVRLKDNGEMLLTNNSISYVIKLDRVSLVGVSEEEIETHYLKVASFYQALLKYDFQLDKYNIPLNEDNSEKFSYINANRNKLTNERLKNLSGDIIQHVMALTANRANSVSEYIVVNNHTEQPDFYSEILKCMEKLSGSLYRPCVCDKEECIIFFRGYLGVDFIDIANSFLNTLPARQFSQIKILNAEETGNTGNLFDVVDIRKEEVIEKFKKQFGGE